MLKDCKNFGIFENLEFRSPPQMTIKFACPSCSVNLRVADTVRPGKRVACPKCENVFPAPDEEDNIGLSKGVARSSRAQKRAARGDEDDWEDEERPSPRKSRKKPRQEDSKTPLLLALIGLGVVLIGGGVTLAVVLLPSKKKSDTVADNNKDKASTDGRPKQDGDSPGRKVFNSNGCARCHAIGPGAGRKRGPDLSRVGADPRHTVDWLSEHIKDPQTHRPGSSMPGYAGRIQPNDMRSLAEYLASLK
jgi:mono/diheme cytochrome c family protein